MTLDREDIVAIAAEVVRQMRLAEDTAMDLAYEASRDDFKERQGKKLAAARAQLKAAEKRG